MAARFLQAYILDRKSASVWQSPMVPSSMSVKDGLPRKDLRKEANEDMSSSSLASIMP